jgi:4-hydroxythreonine-4-phosphate dehydrogenase
MVVISTGCPCGVGPEVSVAAAAALPGVRALLVGDLETLRAAARAVGISERRIVSADADDAPKGSIRVLQAGPRLSAADRRRGKPTQRSGAAQLEYIEAAYRFAKAERAALVSAPVSKAAIAHSGVHGAARFRGHTEWLRDLDGARHAVMCFAAPGLMTSLVTTHVPLAKVPRELTKNGVRDATLELANLLAGVARRKKRFVVAIASLNPHAGESELLGREERTAILPGIRLAASELGRRANLVGPLGAETAYRLMRAGKYDGVVAMYHDQATIPMKLVAFGDAVNVTMGLSVVRTSVDHGTAYDIAWKGKADPAGMVAAVKLGERLAAKTPAS